MSFIILSFNGLLHAQKVHQLNLEQAVEMALQNAEELKNLKLDVEIQWYLNKEITGMTLPQVSGSGQGTYYTNRPKIQFPSSNYPIYKVLEDEGVKDQSGNPISTNKATTTSLPISFVAPLNFQFGVSVNQLLFQPDVFIALVAKQTVLQSAKDNVKVGEVKIREAVQKAYYAVLIARLQKQVVEETAVRLDRLSVEMAEMYKSGFVEKLDVDKLTVSQNNIRTAINQLVNAISISEDLLKNTLGIPIADQIELTEQLNTEELNAELFLNPTGFTYENRSEIALLNTARKLTEIDLRRQQISYLPSVAAFYQFQRSGQRNPSFAQPGTSPWFWYTTGLVGIAIDQPIFDGLQRKQRIEQAKLKLLKVDNGLNQLKRAIDMEQNIAKNSLKSALLSLEIQQRNMNLAKEIFETSTKKYESGIGSSIEIVQADSELQRSQGAYFSALYDCYVALIAVKKSLGKL